MRTDAYVRVPEFVRRHPARQRVLAAAGQQLVGSREHGFEHAFVDVVLVATAASRRREQQIIEVPTMGGLVLGEDVVQHWHQVDRAQARCRLGALYTQRPPHEVHVSPTQLFQFTAPHRGIQRKD